MYGPLDGPSPLDFSTIFSQFKQKLIFKCYFLGFQGFAYYIVADGAYANHTIAHINDAIDERGFNVIVKDLTSQMGILSIQGPKRYSSIVFT